MRSFVSVASPATAGFVASSKIDNHVSPASTSGEIYRGFSARVDLLRVSFRIEWIVSIFTETCLLKLQIGIWYSAYVFV